jgi:type II secretory pathway pseudopilin PulG
MVVVTIIGILAGVSVVSYSNAKEKSLDKEATAALVLIRNAERQYFSRFERFWPSGTTITTLTQINGNLSLDLSSTNWAFGVTGGASGVTYNASCTRAGRRWAIAGLTGNPTCSGTCFSSRRSMRRRLDPSLPVFHQDAVCGEERRRLDPSLPVFHQDAVCGED